MAGLLTSVTSGKIIAVKVFEMSPGHSVWSRTYLVFPHGGFGVIRVTENVGVCICLCFIH